MLCGLCHIAQAACACAGAGGGASANPNPNQGSWAASAGEEAGGETGGGHCVKRRTYPSSVHCASCRALWRPPFHGGNHGTQSPPLLGHLASPHPPHSTSDFFFFSTITHTRPSRTTHTHAHKHSATHVTHDYMWATHGVTTTRLATRLHTKFLPTPETACAAWRWKCERALRVGWRLPTTRRGRQGARGPAARARRGSAISSSW